MIALADHLLIAFLVIVLVEKFLALSSFSLKTKRKVEFSVTFLAVLYIIFGLL